MHVCNLLIDKKPIITDLSYRLLERKIELCRELIGIGDVLEPGWSPFRGYLLFDLQAALVEKIKRDLDKGAIDEEAAKVSTYLN